MFLISPKGPGNWENVSFCRENGPVGLESVCLAPRAILPQFITLVCMNALGIHPAGAIGSRCTPCLPQLLQGATAKQMNAVYAMLTRGRTCAGLWPPGDSNKIEVMGLLSSLF